MKRSHDQGRNFYFTRKPKTHGLPRDHNTSRTLYDAKDIIKKK